MVRFLGVAVSLAVLLGLIFHCFTGNPAAAVPVAPKPEPQVLPLETENSTEPAEQTLCRLPYANILAKRLVCFDGPFYEDRNEAEIVGVAALELQNNGDTLVEYVEAVVYQEQRQLRFEATYIPPGGSVLVLEKDAQLYDTAQILDFKCPKIVAVKLPGSKVQVQAEDACTLKVTNSGDMPIGCVRVFYKQYYGRDDLLLGGVTYSLVLTDLQPGESRKASPYHFATQYSRIVAVFTEP